MIEQEGTPTPRPPGFATRLGESLISYLPESGEGAYLVKPDPHGRLAGYAPPGVRFNGDRESFSYGWRTGYWSSWEAFCSEAEPEEVTLTPINEVLEGLPEEAEDFVRNRTLAFLSHEHITPEISERLHQQLAETFIPDDD